MEAAPKQEIIGVWPIPDMAREMRVEHDRLAQLGWVYDGFGGYSKKAASSHPSPKLAASTSTLIRAASERVAVAQRRGRQGGLQKLKVKRKA
jgi:hypothetical protein